MESNLRPRHYYLSDEQHAYLQREAIRRRTTASWLLRELVNKDIDRQKAAERRRRRQGEEP
jgi:hypothetical protein